MNAKPFLICKVFPRVHETAFVGPTLHNEKRIMYFTYGEILELEDHEEDEAEEELSNRTLFKEQDGRVGMCLEEKIPVWTSMIM